MTSTTRLVTILFLCAASDIAAVPLLLSGDDHPAAAVGVTVGALGVFTAVAAIGIARSTRNARGLSWITRVVDLAAAAPGIGAGGALAGASVVTVVLSLLAVVALVITRPAATGHLPAV